MAAATSAIAAAAVVTQSAELHSPQQPQPQPQQQQHENLMNVDTGDTGDILSIDDLLNMADMSPREGTRAEAEQQQMEARQQPEAAQQQPEAARQQQQPEAARQQQPEAARQQPEAARQQQPEAERRQPEAARQQQPEAERQQPEMPQRRPHRKREPAVDQDAIKRQAVEQMLNEHGISLVPVPDARALPKALEALSRRDGNILRVDAPAHDGLWPDGSRAAAGPGPNIKVTLSGNEQSRDALARCEAYSEHLGNRTGSNALPTAAAFGFAVPTDAALSIANHSYALGFEQGVRTASAGGGAERSKRRGGGRLSRCFPPLHRVGELARQQGATMRKGKLALTSAAVYKAFSKTATSINRHMKTHVQRLVEAVDPRKRGKDPPSGWRGLGNWAIHLFVTNTPELRKRPELGGQVGRIKDCQLPPTAYHSVTCTQSRREQTHYHLHRAMPFAPPPQPTLPLPVIAHVAVPRSL